MSVFRYQTTGRWYKGGTHLHSNASDGGRTLEQLDELYGGAGYDFMYLTDHWRPSRNLTSDFLGRVLWLDGMELDGMTRQGRYYHVVCLGHFSELQPRPGFEEALKHAKREGGLLIMAHPHWSGNDLQDAFHPNIPGFDGFDGVEIYNHVCHWINGKGNGLVYWTAMLDSGLPALNFAVDDAHLMGADNGWNGGWIVVNAPVCTPETITQAISDGNFFSSTGPGFLDIRQADGQILVSTTPVQFIRLVGPGSKGKPLGSYGDALLQSAAFTIPWDWPYMYLEIEDENGKRAWTNTLFR